MTLSPIQLDDLQYLAALQPPDWPDIVIQFHQYILWPPCIPVKYAPEDTIAAVGCAILLEGTAWLGHIIVREDYRGKGIGTSLTRALLELPELRKVETVSLVSTAAGLPVYQKVGFIAEAEYHFYRRGDRHVETGAHPVARLEPGMVDRLLQLDKLASGEERYALLKGHLRKALCYTAHGQLLGYYLPTFGEGLIVATEEEAGLALARLRLQSNAEAVVPADNASAIQLLHGHDFAHYLTGIRMRVGKSLPYRMDMIYNRIGGNLG